MIKNLRFQAEGIRYEIWSLNTLLTSLRPWPELMERYIDQGRGGRWVDLICGPPYHRLGGGLAGKRGATTPKPSLEPQFAELMTLAAQGLTSKLIECRFLARRGLIAQAEASVAGILSEPATVQVTPVAVRARGLRLQASQALDRPNGEAAAKTLLAEVKRLDGTSAARLHAQIILNERGPGSCLEYLQMNGDGSEEELCLRAACHLRTGRAKAAVVLLEPLIPDATSADSERLLGLALSVSARPEQACTHARSAHARESELGHAHRARRRALFRFHFESRRERMHRRLARALRLASGPPGRRLGRTPPSGRKGLRLADPQQAGADRPADAAGLEARVPGERPRKAS